MPTINVPSVPVTLADGKIYRLRYGYNSLCDIEQSIGMSLGELQACMIGQRAIGVTVLRGLLWSGLHKEHRQLTVEAVGDLIFGDGPIDAKRIEDIGQQISKALLAAFSPIAEPKNADAPAETPAAAA